MRIALIAATAAVSLSAGSALAVSLSPLPYSSIYAFGDSLSDAGNAYILDGETNPLPPYSGGRFSNGNVWVQDLSQMLGLPAVTPSLLGGNDFAVGGATSIDLQAEIADFVALHGFKAPSTGLYTLSIGANDIFSVLSSFGNGKINVTQALTEVSQAAAEASAATDELFAFGARRLVWFDVPDLGVTPRYNSNLLIRAYASFFALAFDQDIASDLKPVEAVGLKVFDLNTYTGIDEFVVNPPIGFNVTSPCWTGNDTGGPGTPCSNPNQYLFWDSGHPTAEGHLLVAEDACNAIGVCNAIDAMPLLAAADPPSTVPESSTWVMIMLGFAGLGFARFNHRSVPELRPVRRKPTF
jgi:phospholipase/lecithinase/hemolysin